MTIFRRNPAAKLQRLHFKYTAISCEDHVCSLRRRKKSRVDTAQDNEWHKQSRYGLPQSCNEDPKWNF